MYIVMRSSWIVIPLVWCWRSAGMFAIFSGSMNTLKQSARLVFSVTDGSNVISLFSNQASSLFAFLLLVSDRLSCCAGAVGFSLGISLLSLFWASMAHLCGFSQPLLWSSKQSSQ